MQEELLRKQLYEAFENRAILYWLFYDELSRELGPARAEEIMSRAIYRRGLMRSEKYRPFAPDNLSGLCEAFLSGLADGGRMFQPNVIRCDKEALDIKFQACPLRETWQKLGLDGETVATLCRIAAKIDDGTFLGAGFEFTADTWRPGGEGCCFLHIRPGKKKE
jgi:hypothetical protein